MPLTKQQIGEVADSLKEAWVSTKTVVPPSQKCRDLDLPSSYEIQDALVALIEADGNNVVGFKAAATSVSAMQALGTDSALFGRLFSDRWVRDERMSIADYISPKLELEVAVVLQGAELSSKTNVELSSLIKSIHLAFEIADSRVGWSLLATDLVADNASGRGFVVGGASDPSSLDHLATSGFEIRRNEEIVGEGITIASLANGLDGVISDLAKWTNERQINVKEDMVILTGNLGPAIPLVRGDHFEARSDSLGSLTLIVE